MTEISMLAIDLAKGRFQVYAIGPGGLVIYNSALSRSRLIVLLAGHAPAHRREDGSVERNAVASRGVRQAMPGDEAYRGVGGEEL